MNDLIKKAKAFAERITGLKWNNIGEIKTMVVERKGEVYRAQRLECSIFLSNEDQWGRPGDWILKDKRGTEFICIDDVFRREYTEKLD